MWSEWEQPPDTSVVTASVPVDRGYSRMIMNDEPWKYMREKHKAYFKDVPDFVHVGQTKDSDTPVRIACLRVVATWNETTVFATSRIYYKLIAN
jgi:hypothetical protein